MKAAFRTTVCVVVSCLICGASHAQAACSSPDGSAGAITWNGTDSVIWCDGAAWHSLADGAGANAAGDAGQIQFNDGSDALAADADLAWDNVNKRLGIGKAVPSAALHMEGTGGRTIRNDTVGDAATDYSSLNFGAGSTNGAKMNRLSVLVHGDGRTITRYGITLGGWAEISAFSPTTTIAGGSVVNGTKGIIIGTGTPTPLVFGTSDIERARIDSAGNIGIGDTSPDHRLVVQTATNASADGISVVSPNSGNIAIRPDVAAGGANPLVQAGDATFVFTDGTINSGNLFIGPWSSGSAGIRMTSGGNVGLGTAVPAYTLDVNGTVRATTYLYPSDARLKADIQTIDGVTIVSRLRGVSFRWKDSGKLATGVVAQEVEAVLPTAVSTDATGQKSVDYVQLIGPLIEAVKDLKADNDNLRSDVDELKRSLIEAK